MPPTRLPADREQTRAAVAARYAGLARAAQEGEQIIDCDPGAFTEGGFGPAGYQDAGGLPDGAVRASLGCGNPVAVADLHPGETVLDLARAHARQAGAGNVEFLRGQIEAIPLPDRSVDVIISNCVINLSTDRPAVFAEAFRVLRSGGRLGISDILAEDHLTPAQQIERGREVGCIAGAPSFTEYHDGLVRAGFAGITITPTRQVADGLHAAIIRAARP